MLNCKIFVNAELITMDPELQNVTAFSVIDGKFGCVGTEADVIKQSGADCEIIDLKNRVVLPGFIESHNHLSHYSLNKKMIDCTPSATASISDIREKIKEAVALKNKDQVILGWGYDDTMIEENRHLTRFDMDDIAPENPVYITHTSSHLAYANSAALLLGKITRETPQSEGGEIHKDEDGEPSGLLIEPAAMDLVGDKLPKAKAVDLLKALPEALADYNKVGVTSAHDAGIGMLGTGPDTIEAYRSLERKGELSVRVYMTLLFDFYDLFLDGGIRNGFGSDYLRLGSVKLFLDGSIQALTAALKEDYFEKPGVKGELIMPQKELNRLVERYHAMGMQIAIHANGDRAIESALIAFERANEICPNTELRHMIIHCQMASDDQIRRMKKLGIIPNYFVSHVYFWGDRHVERFIGFERASRIDPVGSAIKEGLMFALHRDTPVTPISPLGSIHDAVNRETRNGMILGEEQRISAFDAVKAFTTNAAYCSFEEHIKGSITPGKLADFVVLSDNPITVSPETIKDIEVCQTVVGGKTIYKKGTNSSDLS